MEDSNAGGLPGRKPYELYLLPLAEMPRPVVGSQCNISLLAGRISKRPPASVVTSEIRGELVEIASVHSVGPLRRTA
jgi:hypothetical protein